ncbi:MAG: metallophosphoesterase [Peptostreptococcaceae bacterium]|nr:metallophosphoesterase [Peptostreptococcaceae bacterium]
MKKNKRRNNKRMLVVAGAVALLLGMGLDQRLEVVNYTIADSRIQKPIRIALVADLHSCNYGEKQHTLTEAVDQSRPDVLLLAGDIIDDDLPEDKAWEFLSWAGEKYPSYYVSGNHECWTEELPRLKSTVLDYNIAVFEGDKVELDIRGQRVNLFGIDDVDIGESAWQNQLEKAKSKIEPDIYSLLLTHRPERYEQYRDFDLSMAGHAHGGQWRIPGVLNGLLAPNQGLFPKYAGGLYEFENYKMIVSRGLARESTRIPRFYNRPEYVVIDLVPSEEHR